MAMKRIKDKRGYLYILPALLLVSLFVYMPFFKSLVYSFFSIDSRGELKNFVFLSNYRKLLTNEAFVASIRHTLTFVAIFLPLNTFLTLLSASVIRRKTKFSAVIGSIYILPLAYSLSFSSLIFKEIFNGKASIANRISGLDISWLNTPSSALWAIVFLSLFLDFALDHILLLSAFRKIERNIIEASLIDGANEAQRYFLIELPQIVPTILMTAFIALKDALLISAPIMTLTEGGPYRSTESVMYYYYLEVFKSSNRAAGAAISTIMVTISAFIVFIYYLLQRRRDYV